MNLLLPTASRFLSSLARRRRRGVSALLCGVLLLNNLALAAYCYPATPGQNGSPTTLTGVVNTYYVPSAASVTAGPTTSAIALGTVQGASSAIAPGDMALIIQMQCADINSTDTDAYGGGVSNAAVSLRAAGDPLVTDKMINNTTGDASGYLGTVSDPCLVGQYEYVRAGPATTGVSLDLSGNTNGSGGTLYNTYVQAPATTTAGRRTFQIIRVPQYSQVTLSGNLSAFAWNGSSGGVLALDVAGSLNFNGNTISAKGMGFRPGTTFQRSNTGGFASNNPARPAGGFSLAAANGYTYRAPATANLYAGKGEGIAGTPLASATADGYPGGDWGRGAPGNAGGGGAALRECCRDNGGGGGGGNGGPGGIGGTGWANNGRPYATLADANTGPTKLKTSFVWTDTDLFGFGGAKFAAASASRVVMGGGGGSGDCNDCGTQLIRDASAGGAGGGIVMVRAGSITGSGTVDVRGNDAPGQANNDAAGGGGGGGSIIVLAAAASTPTLNLTTKGGRGGDSYIGGTGPHGPGGGGGGGVVFQGNLSSPTIDVSGGASGQTNTSINTPVQQIWYGNNTNTGNTTPADIAARQAFGSSGGTGFTGTTTITVSGDNPRAAFGAVCLPSLTVTKKTSNPLLNTPTSTQTPSYQITVTNASTAGAATSVQLSDTLPVPFTYAGPTTATLSSAAVTRPSVSDPAAGATALNWGSFTLPGGQSVTLDFPVNRLQGVGTFQNSASVSFVDPTDSTGTRRVSPLTAALSGANTSYTGGGNVTGSNYDSASSTAEDIVIEHDLQVTKQAVASGTATALTTRTNAQTFDYLITVSNIKAVNATNVQVSDTNFPASVTLGTPSIVSSPSTPATSATFDTATKLLMVPALAAGQSVTVRLPVTVNTTAASTTPNTASLTASTPADSGSNGSSTANNSQTVNTYFNPVQLRKYVRNLSVTPAQARDTTRVSTTAKPGDTLEYCIDATSILTAARNVSVSDVLEANQGFVTGSYSYPANSSGGSYNTTTKTVAGTFTGISSTVSGTFCFQTTVN